MLYHIQISVAYMGVKLSTNELSIYDYLLKNYNKHNGFSKGKIHIQSFKSIDELQVFYYRKYKIKINFSDNISDNIEMRAIGQSFVVRILHNNDAEIYYYNDAKNDITELIYSMIEYTIFRLLPYNSIILHASMVEYNGQAIIFSGKSGSGKTTMAILSHNYGANIIENEHTIFNIDNNLTIYNTSKDIRIKEDVSKKTSKIIDYNNVTITPGRKHYKSLLIVFLEFGKFEIKDLHINETIGYFLNNLIRCKQENARITIENIKKILSYDCVKTVKVNIERNNYISSKKAIENLIKEI
jgi:hypothetical protein